MDFISSATSAPNIALIKYWGKRDDLLKLALNESISITLNQKQLCTKTTVVLSDKLKKDVFVVNGKKVEDEKIAEWLMLARKYLVKKGYAAAKLKLLLVTSNNFPSSAGIASSASGFAAASTALCSALGIRDKKEMSIVARLGSGSACRSIEGGFVKWKLGKREDGEDSFGVQIAPSPHWKDIVDVIAITDEKKKKVSSKDGMETAAKTSQCMKCRSGAVSGRVDAVQKAILKKDFPLLALYAMRDSNSMHSTCLDSWPPTFYMNDISKEIVYAVHELNEKNGTIAGYTFDAGPNAHIITTKRNVKKVAGAIGKVKGVKRIIYAEIGDGVKIVAPDKKLVYATMKKLELIKKYADKKQFNQDDKNWMEKNDWHPVDERPLKKKFIEEIKAASKRPGKKISLKQLLRR